MSTNLIHQSKLEGRKFEIVDLSPDPLRHDLACQQPLRDGKVVDIIRRGYDPALAGIIVVSRRTEIRHGLPAGDYVLDGWTRTNAAIRSGISEILAEVWHELTEEEEAWLFAYLNRKSNPPAIHTFRSRVNCNEEIPNKVVDVLYAHGWELSEGGEQRDGKFLAVVAAERIYRGKGPFASKMISGADLFTATIDLTSRAWGHDKFGADGGVIGGLAALLAKYWDEIDNDGLLRTLQSRTPVMFRAGGRGIRENMGLPLTSAQAFEFHRQYNKGRRSGKLSAFVV